MKLLTKRPLLKLCKVWLFAKHCSANKLPFFGLQVATDSDSYAKPIVFECRVVRRKTVPLKEAPENSVPVKWSPTKRFGHTKANQSQSVTRKSPHKFGSKSVTASKLKVTIVAMKYCGNVVHNICTAYSASHYAVVTH